MIPAISSQEIPPEELYSISTFFMWQFYRNSNGAKGRLVTFMEDDKHFI